MPELTFEGRTYACASGETVLDSLLRQGAAVPYSCRSGTCQTCMLRADAGPVPADAQTGLKDTLRASGHFLACSCRPAADMTVALPGAEAGRLTARVHAIEPLNSDIAAVSLDCPSLADYRAGQFINLYKDPTLGRSYSLASVPGQDRYLQLHVRRLPDGRVSGWIHDALAAGMEVEIGAPAGNCFYLPGRPEQGLLLIGTGSGLAPLYGIVRDALAQGHTGPIRLYHGSRAAGGLYLQDELRALAAAHGNLTYVPCVSGESVPGCRTARATDAALADLPDPSGWRLFLCGHPDMVKASRRRAFLAGVANKDILADPFTIAA